jgi:peptide/nickel transport system substrate-binding protein
MKRKKPSKRVSRRDFLRATGAAGLALTLEACAPKPPPTPTPAPAATAVPAPTAAPTYTPLPTPVPVIGTPKRGGVLVASRPGSPIGLDPHLDTNTFAGQRLIPMMYDCLVAWGPNFELIPQIAESWEVLDERTFVLKLRRGVKFHNGREVTIEDVKYSFDRVMDPDQPAEARDWISNVDSVEILSSEEIRFNLKEPDLLMLYTLYWNYIIPQEVQDQPSDYLAHNVIGTGPFMLESFKPDVETKLVRNPHYWKPGLPHLDAIDIRIIPEESTAVAALRTGDVDHVTLDDNNNFELLKRSPNLDLTLTSFNGAYFMNFNGDKDPLTDLKVRQAMSQALDREEFVRVAGAGLGAVCGFVPPAFGDLWVPPEELPYFDYNPEKARQLLKESSVPDGFKMNILVIPTEPLRKTSAELCKRYWEDIGIEVELSNMEMQVWIDTLLNTEDWYFNTNESLKHPTPEGIFETHLKCGIMLTDFYGPCSPELDALVSQCKSTADKAKRKALLREIQIKTAEFVPTITTFSPIVVDAMQKWVKGFQAWPDKAHRGWEHVWLDKA